MTSISDLVLKWDFANDASATDKVSAANLQTELQRIVEHVNSERQIVLEPNFRGDNALADSLILLRMCSSELTNLIASKAGWQPKTEASVISTGNITLSGEQTIDTVLTSLSRVVVNGQTLPQQNGIYLSGAGAWTRVTDADTSAELGYAYVRIASGMIYGGTLWVLTKSASEIAAVGTTPVSFTQCGGVSGPINLTQATTDGPPITGTWLAGATVRDSRGLVYVCITGGTPGSWYALSGRVVNLIDNAFMEVDQRLANSSMAVPSGSSFNMVIDRWFARKNTYGATLSAGRVLSVPSTLGATYSLQLSASVAGGAIAAGEYVLVGQWLGGLRKMLWGTASARPLYLGFWIKSYTTGVFSVAMTVSTSRSYVQDVTIAAVDTWQFVSLVIPGDTGSTLWSSEYLGRLTFCFACGATFRAPVLGAWQAGEYYGSAGTSNPFTVIDGNGIKITGVKLSEDPNLSAEQPEFNRSLDVCKKFFWKTFQYALRPAQNVATYVGAILVSQVRAASQIESAQVKTSLPMIEIGTNPTVTLFNPVALNAEVRDSTLGADCTGSTGANDGTQGISVVFTTAVGSGLGNKCYVHATVDMLK